MIFQHPFYWYSSPAILKQWQDIVLERGFAYGENGDALRGKRWLSAITTGGESDGYQASGFHRFTIRELLAPFEQTARLCGMEFLAPFVTHGTHALSRADIARRAAEYRSHIETLRDAPPASQV